MDHSASGKIQRTDFCEPAVSPQPVSQWCIDNERPQSGEQQQRTKLDPFGKSPGDQGRREGRKEQLEQHEGLERNGRRIDGVGRSADIRKETPIQRTDYAPSIRPEREGETT